MTSVMDPEWMRDGRAYVKMDRHGREAELNSGKEVIRFSDAIGRGSKGGGDV